MRSSFLAELQAAKAQGKKSGEAYRKIEKRLMDAWSRSHLDPSVMYKMALFDIHGPAGDPADKFRRQLYDGFFTSSGMPYFEYARVMFILSAKHEMLLTENGYLKHEARLREVYEYFPNDAQMKHSYIALMRYSRSFLSQFDELIAAMRELTPVYGQNHVNLIATQLWIDRAIKTQDANDAQVALKLIRKELASTALSDKDRRVLKSYEESLSRKKLTVADR